MHSFANFNVAEIPRPRHSKKCQTRNGIFKNSNAHNSILLGPKPNLPQKITYCFRNICSRQ